MTPDSTASVKARRLSSWALAVTSAPVCSSSRLVIRLKALPSVADLVALPRDAGTRAERSPAVTLPRRVDQLADRPDQPVGEVERDPDRERDDQQRDAAAGPR